jgi:hypothetical protein
MTPLEVRKRLDDLEEEMEWRFAREKKYNEMFECSSTVENCIRDLFEYVKLLRAHIRFEERL